MDIYLSIHVMLSGFMTSLMEADEYDQRYAATTIITVSL